MCGRKDSPLVKITLITFFLKVVFNQLVLQQTLFRELCSTKYNITLTWMFYLEKKLALQGNQQTWGLFLYCLDSIEFYLRKRRSLLEYCPPESPGGLITSARVDTGYLLTFIFQRQYENSATFGKKKRYLITKPHILHLYSIQLVIYSYV